MSIHTNALSQPSKTETAAATENFSRKRTRDEVDTPDETDRRPFTIRQNSNNPFGRPLTLTPLHLISRANLPLACLDPSESGSRLFSAYIRALEHQDDEATILVAKEENEGRLYAIERVAGRRYALCRLGQWVNEDEMSGKAGRVSQPSGVPEKRRRMLRPTEEGQPWWKGAAVNVSLQSVEREHAAISRPAFAMQRVMDAPQKTSNTIDVPKAQPSLPVLLGDSTEVDTTRTPQSPQETLQGLTTHYLDSLYLSRTSLAYFTKGPLSRARAAFSTVDMPVNDLVDFLRQSVLSSAVMDKKYRDSIPGIVKEIPVVDADSPQKHKKPRKQKKWKPKRDRAGFFVGEQDFVERWWRDEDAVGLPGSASDESRAGEMRRRVSKIRNRETFLQIILALEVLALEASMPQKDTAKRKLDLATDSQGPETQLENTRAVSIADPAKAKKKQDLPALIETLLDKLTIWHSLESHSPVKSRTTTTTLHPENEEAENDVLRNFCVEVIVPFYVSRIPQHASIVNKKLGGPAAPTPVKRSNSSRATAAPKSKPGELVGRQPPERKPRRPLERVSTDTLNQSASRSHRPIPTLHRSATDSDALLHSFIKREASESVPPLDSIPAARPPRTDNPKAAPRPRGTASLMPLSRREVDLSAMSQASEAKLRKKAEMEEKLKEAISTLRKPQREKAVKEVAESADSSFAKAVAKGGSKTTTTTGRVGKEGMVVAATPSRYGRRGAVVKDTPHARPQTSAAKHALPTSSASTTYVPSSSTRLRAEQQVHHDPPDSTPAIPATGHRPRYHYQELSHISSHGIEETPSRGFARCMPVGLAREPGTLESPVACRKSAAVVTVAGTPSKVIKHPAASLIDLRVEAEVAVSPACRPPNRTGSSEDGEVRKEGGGGESLYESLGWDDDVYEELV